MFDAPVLSISLISGLLVVVDSDVFEQSFRQAQIPFLIPKESIGRTSVIRLFFSEDRGKTWKLADERKPSENRFTFRADRDGLFWFAYQTEEKDGGKHPAEAKEFTAGLRVYVNQERRILVRRTTPSK